MKRKLTDRRGLYQLYNNLLDVMDEHPDVKKPLKPYQAMRWFTSLMLQGKLSSIKWRHIDDILYFGEVAERRYYK